MDMLWALFGLLAAGFLGWPVTSGVLRLARAVEEGRPPVDDADSAADSVPDPDSKPPESVTSNSAEGPLRQGASQPGPGPGQPLPGSVLRGGLMIGILERLAVGAAVLSAQPVAIAYVVAVKGLGRYAELKETPAASERFIIGTLASMLWAVAVTAPIRIYAL